MDTKEILKKVRKIEIKTKRLSNDIFGGEYRNDYLNNNYLLELDRMIISTSSTYPTDRRWYVF